jgi:hypothetical protein
MMKRTTIGFWLDVIPGLLGLFGFGEIYLGKKLRGEAFLAWTAGLYVAVLLSFALQGLSYYWGYLPIVWGLGYLLLLVDIFRITRKPAEAT